MAKRGSSSSAVRMSPKQKMVGSWYTPSEDLKKRLKIAEDLGMTTARYNEHMKELTEQTKDDMEAYRIAKKSRESDDKKGIQIQKHITGPPGAAKDEPSPGSKTTSSLSSPPNSESSFSPKEKKGKEPQHQIQKTELGVPQWYKAVNPKGRKMQVASLKASLKKYHETVQAFNALKDCLDRCERERNPNILAKYFDELRDHIHKAGFLPLDEKVLFNRHMLDNGLNRIFSPQETVTFPWDLQADARQLHTRWAERNFAVELLRGIITARTENRSADKIDPAWRRKFPNPPNYYGQGNLVLGQWWPTQLCTVRDGAHGSAQGGIYGERNKGAYSIVVSGGSHYGYSDQDSGDELLYCGTTAKVGVREPTENTMRLIESCNVIKRPVRVIRSAQLAPDNPYRPEVGLRYDGLYDVVSYEVLSSEGAIHRFRLVRCPGQNPIRYQGREKKPAEYEIKAYQEEVMMRAWNLQASGATAGSS